MDKDSILNEIFANDPFGILTVKPLASQARNEDERLIASFLEICDFYEKNKREPLQTNGIQEHQLYTRLKGLRENPTKVEILKNHDKFGLLMIKPKEFHSLDDILNDDSMGILDSNLRFPLSH
ncbi:MAG TPA: GIY-YIG nuclease family protein, partial [Leptospiraceae bacterium]|nr:GIY-YIG nuclease family protein [Leptospiraceae bacterium]